MFRQDSEKSRGACRQAQQVEQPDAAVLVRGGFCCGVRGTYVGSKRGQPADLIARSIGVLDKITANRGAPLAVDVAVQDTASNSGMRALVGGPDGAV